MTVAPTADHWAESKAESWAEPQVAQMVVRWAVLRAVVMVWHWAGLTVDSKAVPTVRLRAGHSDAKKVVDSVLQLADRKVECLAVSKVVLTVRRQAEWTGDSMVERMAEHWDQTQVVLKAAHSAVVTVDLTASRLVAWSVCSKAVSRAGSRAVYWAATRAGHLA